MSIFIKCRGQTQDWGDEVRFAPDPGHARPDPCPRPALGTPFSRSHGAAPFAVGVTFFGLKDERNDVFPLLGRPAHDRRRALLRAVDKLNIKEGKNTVYFAGACGAVGYTPMRIAFNRIPDPDTER